MRIRVGLRSKLLALSCFLFTIPWFGYQYVWEMEKYLRFGQEQTIVGTARALATSLHERPNLFNNQASFLPSVAKGKDLYSYQLTQAIQLDGLSRDWPNLYEYGHYYGEQQQLHQQLAINELSLHFTTMVGKYDKFLYLFFNVVDNRVIYRGKNNRSLTHNDHLEIAYLTPEGNFQRFMISNQKAGWLAAYRVSDLDHNIPVTAAKIQGQWLETPQGYTIELRFPLSQVGEKIAFAIHDVDQIDGQVITTIGSADPSNADTLGTILVPSPEIERIVKGMSYTNSSIWVVDQHQRVLARAGDIKRADGVWQAQAGKDDSNSIWQQINHWLRPWYDKILTKPPEDFIDQLYDASKLTGKHITSALNGSAMSQWRLTQDQQAVILSAAYPIYINNQVQGAVIVEETTNGIRTLRNRALEKLFSAMLAILLVATLVFFIFASRISSRILQLRNQAEFAIDRHGRINSAITASNTNDEIGDLSRSFANVVKRLSQYNHYLENMAARLTHELRTPIAVVRTSLENLAMQKLPATADTYIERAQSGVSRLNHIITQMSEATRIEQMLQSTEKAPFDLQQVVSGCVQGYRQIYHDHHFTLTLPKESTLVSGSPDHIAQLLDKVITNAVDFSSDRQIAIALSHDKNLCRLSIRNNGVLLPDNMQDKLFNSMVSVRDNADTANNAVRQQLALAIEHQPHLGLGLYIARLICEFHHGKIDAKNHHAPAGVIVTIALPRLLNAKN